MIAQDLIKDIKNRQFKPVYLLTGEEPFFIDQVADALLKNVLTEQEKAFNETILYGKDSDAHTIIDAARRFPMMSEFQLIMVKEAQHLKNIDELVHYTDKPLKSTVLVIIHKYKKLDKRKKLYNSIKQKGAILDSKKLYEDKVPAWIENYLKGKKVGIDPKACLLLVDFLGNDLGKLVNELDKLMITLPEGTSKITPQHIEENIGISKDYNNIELQKAFTDNNWLKAVKIIQYFGKNPKNNPLVLSITSMYFFFSKILMYHFTTDKTSGNVASVLKINPYFVNEYKKAAQRFNPKKTVEIIGLLRQYDLKSKGVGNSNTPDDQLLMELVYKIMH